MYTKKEVEDLHSTTVTQLMYLSILLGKYYNYTDDDDVYVNESLDILQGLDLMDEIPKQCHVRIKDFLLTITFRSRDIVVSKELLRVSDEFLFYEAVCTIKYNMMRKKGNLIVVVGGGTLLFEREILDVRDWLLTAEKATKPSLKVWSSIEHRIKDRFMVQHPAIWKRSMSLVAADLSTNLGILKKGSFLYQDTMHPGRGLKMSEQEVNQIKLSSGRELEHSFMRVDERFMTLVDSA